MKERGDISGFGSFGGAHNGDREVAVDFAKARRLERGGSTCEAYEATWQRRHVFVKRLRPEFRDNPQYRAAFDKEFDLGVSLSHPSLPRYIALHDDYIVMDYVEGDTLATLIERKDSRLKDKVWERNLLGQLVDVIDYLHHRHVVHCDVKADNVIVSPYADRPATLIDLDKAYTSWLDGTPGNPQNYDCEDCADGVIDYKGLAKIAEQLGERSFANLCRKADVTAAKLRSLLKPKKPERKSSRWPLLIFLTVIMLFAAFMVEHGKEIEQSKVEMIETDSVVEVADSIETPTPIVGPVPPVTPAKPSIDSDWIGNMIRSKVAGLDAERGDIRLMFANDTLPINVPHEAFSEYIIKSGSVKTDIIFSAVRHYPTFPELEVQQAVRAHPLWLKLDADDSTLLDEYQQFMQQRRSNR